MGVFRGLAPRIGKTLNMRRPYFGVPHRNIRDPNCFIRKQVCEELIRWMVDIGLSTYEEVEAHPRGTHFKNAERLSSRRTQDADARFDMLTMNSALLSGPGA